MKKKRKVLRNFTSMRGSFLLNLIIGGVIAGFAIVGIIKVITSITTYQQQDYQHVYQDMQTIANAAQKYQADYGAFPPDPRVSGRNVTSPPPELVPKYLSSWPTPPCQGWKYGWINPEGGEAEVIIESPNQALYYMCLSSTDANSCSRSLGGPALMDIATLPGKKLDCSTIILK